ncbi:DUF3047 domain-containing protein [Hyphomicrobium sp.]|uniref:DUF3047 domain-containing protein n=1 Tax=Hyphomicrobium sp. TaxID=82 RepID=UPI0025B7E54D|nr:DUF3047 domain-containing protein [Hyphomicrobium sp.]MCC7250557.1 DUF3047 domain-containing protein [Hyphomicrobium sp.]
MCTLPDHRDCGCQHSTAVDRRDLLKRLTALGLTLPFATAVLDARTIAGAASFLDRAEFIDRLDALIARAKSPELLDVRVFEITSSDLPWKDIDLTLAKGQQATFLLGGRLWLSREQDLWAEPGVAFHARTRGTRPIYNPMSNTGTMTAAHDGPIEVARSFAEFQNEDGEIWTPTDAYLKTEVRIYGLALVWRKSALDGLRSLLAHGDVGGVIGAEIDRLETSRKLPEGWNNLYMLGGGPVIFNDLGGGEIACEPLKNAGILQRPVSIELKPGTKLNWRWIVEELPSRLPEDQLTSHDYLSIGAEYDDGQDLTYFWSSGLPVGKAFRCPIPRWTPIESHMAVRSGFSELGTWVGDERDLYADYHDHIGGPAKSVVRIWLLGVSVFQRRRGSCRFGDIQISQPGAETLKI